MGRTKQAQPKVDAPSLIRKSYLYWMGQQKMTITEIAQKLGVHRQAVSNFLGGGGPKDGANPSIGTLQRYSEAIGLSLELLLAPVFEAEREGRLTILHSEKGRYLRKPKAHAGLPAVG
jgi:transcriptional regulator with XRE-family HTH domain